VSFDISGNCLTNLSEFINRFALKEFNVLKMFHIFKQSWSSCIFDARIYSIMPPTDCCMGNCKFATLSFWYIC